MDKRALIEKNVGETPLEALEKWRAGRPDLLSVPLAYAGRLDPMASGKLLILIGEECKQQQFYHALDKEYEFEVLLGVHSDTGDVLGIVKEAAWADFSKSKLDAVLKKHTGKVTFTYPTFSSKTVKGKPLHTWAVEGRLSEIKIPNYSATIYKLKLESSQTCTRQEVYDRAIKKINLLPPVTDPRKSLGNDFRRPEVRQAWKKFKECGDKGDKFLILTIKCLSSSGVYIRTLVDEIGKGLGTRGLALSIHRTKIGTYRKVLPGIGFFSNVS